MTVRKRDDIILLSIEPKFAQQIFDGEKEFEFRKPHLPQDLSYIVLVENGTRKILGGFRVGEIHEEKIENLWKDFASSISDFDRFNRYYEGWETGLAIEVEEPDPFDEPLPLEEITKADKHLQVPNQFSFIYLTKRSLQILSSYSDIIQEIFPVASLSEWTDDDETSNQLSFRRMKEEEVDHFRELFLESPVPTSYEDIDNTFIDHILESHRRENDPYGYFTDKKSIYTFLKGSEPVGYTVTTWKIGNSVKYGPTLLAEKHRGKGFGPKFRRLVDEELRSQGVRKAYSTIPDDQTNAYKYLIKSGYEVEAHMREQYHEDHSELVFGKLLSGGTPGDVTYPCRDDEENIEFSVGSHEVDDLSKFVVDMMSPWYENIGEDFVNSVLDAEDRELEGDLSKKGKRIYVGHKDGKTRCAVIASLKRGGGVKISPFLTEILGDEVLQFIDFVESDLQEEINKARKLYTHVPILDRDLVRVFRSAGYQSEGLLRQPYKDGIDMVFLGRIVD